MHLNFSHRAIRRAALLITLASGSSQGALAQSTWDRYQPGTLSDVVRDADSAVRTSIREVDATSHGSVDNTKPSVHFLATQYPTLAALVYTGHSRPITQIRREMISDWGRSFMRDSAMAADFHREYLFREGNTAFWLAVQDTVATFFPKELHPGQQANLFVMLLAGYYDAGKITWAFIVTEFNSSPVARARTF